jgi:peptidoglycan hydrolase-like protein with peptidoglycan-binding domain
MSRSFWAAAITVLVMSLIPGVALAANSTSSRSSGASAKHEPKQPRVDRVVLEPGSGLSLPGGAANVRSLQRQLVRMGFSPGPVDGRYGPLTVQAVKSFQQAHGLVVDGIVGPETHKALAGGLLVSGAGYLQPGGSPAVRSLQRRLSRAGFSPGPADGRYGPLTAQAVRRFQHEHRLAADGIAGALTLHALGSQHPKASSPPRHTAPGPRHHTAPRPHRHTNPSAPKPRTTAATPKPQTPPAQRAAHGSSWLKWVILAVLIVIAIAVLVLVGPDRRPKRAAAEDANAAAEDGAPPSATAAVAAIAVAAAVASVPASKAAADPIPAPEAATPEPPPEQETPAPVPAHAPPVPEEVPSSSADPLAAFEETMLASESAVAVLVEVRAERAERVKALQRQLSLLGFDPGPVDGRYGPATTEALKRFQQRHRLPMDGIADSHTLNALGNDIAQIPQQTPHQDPGKSDEAGKPDEADRVFRHAVALEEQGELAGAVAAYQRADQLGHGTAASNLGVLLEQHGDRAAAEACFRRADQRGDAVGAFNLALLLGEQGDHLGAVEAYQRAHQLGYGVIADMARLAALDLTRQIAGGKRGGHDLVADHKERER